MIKILFLYDAFWNPVKDFFNIPSLEISVVILILNARHHWV